MSPGIFCGEDGAGNGKYCPTAGFCCARRNDGNLSFECLNGNPLGQCIGGSAVRCDDRSDCPGTQVCCGSFDQNLGYRGIQCASNCNSSPIPGFQAVRFCDANAPTDECASIGKTCTPSGSLDGFSVCK